MYTTIALETITFTFTLIMFILVRMFATQPAEHHTHTGRHAVAIVNRTTVTDLIRSAGSVGQIYTARHVIRSHRAGHEMRYA